MLGLETSNHFRLEGFDYEGNCLFPVDQKGCCIPKICAQLNDKLVGSGRANSEGLTLGVVKVP